MKYMKSRALLVTAGIMLMALVTIYAAPVVAAKMSLEGIGANPTTWNLKNKGFVYGKVGIGPLCGAISVGPDGQEICGGDPYDHLKDIKVQAFKHKKNGKKVLKGEASIDRDGHYQMFLPAGKYTINIDPNHWTPRCDGDMCVQGPGHVNAPLDIKIKPHTVTRFNINISTGIL